VAPRERPADKKVDRTRPPVAPLRSYPRGGVSAAPRDAQDARRQRGPESPSTLITLSITSACKIVPPRGASRR
jgi:hypothetical protein